MRGQAVLDGSKAYVAFLLKTLVFPLVWIGALKAARRHQDTDPRGAMKVGAAIAAGIVLALGVTGMLWNFQSNAEAGMYDALDGRLSQSVGEGEYQDQVSAIAAADGQLVILQDKFDAAQAAGEEENATAFQANIDSVQATRADAMARKAELEPAHELYGRLSVAVQAQDDARAKSIIAAASYEYDGMDSSSTKAFAVKDDAVDAMMGAMIWVLYPGVVGVFFAPLVIAVASTLRTAFEDSDSVGFKPYPGKALGLFLLMGAFGVPALFFAAWGFWDMDVRSKTGQISL